jgi:hypothetical protein
MENTKTGCENKRLYRNDRHLVDNYDAIIIPGGEERTGENAYPVTRQAISLFRLGRFGCIFVTGRYSGLSEVNAGTRTEGEETAEYLMEMGIPEEKVFYDDQSLETVGNFTFPIVSPQRGNPKLTDFRSMLIAGKKGHMWRIKDYTSVVLPQYQRAGDIGFYEAQIIKKIGFHEVEGRHNDGLAAKVYHAGIMNALKGNVSIVGGAEEAHEFLIEKHPFYSEGWYDKRVRERKVKMALKGLSWLAFEGN